MENPEKDSDIENSFDDLNSEHLQILPPDYPDGGCDEVGADEEDGELPGPDGLLHQEGGDPGHGEGEEQGDKPCGHTEERVSKEWSSRHDKFMHYTDVSPDVVPCTAAGGSLLGRKVVVDLNDRWLLWHHHLALGADLQLGDLLLELGRGEVRDDDQAADEGWDKQYLAGSEEIILKTSRPVPRQVAVGGGDQADGGGHHHHHHHDPFPKDHRAELQVKRHLEVPDERHNGYQGGK